MNIKDIILAYPPVYRLVSSMVDRDKLRAISRLGNDFSGLKVLDLGCGPGSTARIFLNSDYTGIDINPRYIDIAARRYPGLNFLAGDVKKEKWGGGFDLILINSLLHHLDDEETAEILLKAAAAIKRSGRVIIQEPLIPERDEWYHRMMMNLDRGNYFRDLADWKHLLETAGLFPGDVYFYQLRVFGFKGYHMVSMSLTKRTELSFATFCT